MPESKISGILSFMLFRKGKNCQGYVMFEKRHRITLLFNANKAYDRQVVEGVGEYLQATQSRISGRVSIILKSG